MSGGPSGMKPRFSGQPPVDAYGDGGFRLEGQRFEGSIIVTPQGLHPWSVAAIGDVTVASLAVLTDAAGTFDFLLVGSGEAFARLPAQVQKHLESQGLFPDLMATAAACRTYNMMLAENRRVAAALIAVA
ncbi:Mth938-like domain-containing protein [Parvibaculum sp.]|uniref:Mth938-like domain-containing protein n=1 Tax=Parvibaculum sp. TaxID=2024848 RepID=UPI0025CFD5E0|nr:Mth938-like domain-containing protein [Parvibaculum sp.]